MQIETLPIDTLIPYARNSRTHSDEQVAQIAASIREFGFTNPVLIDGDGGLIAGHGRVMGARKLGLAEVPCIRLAHLTEAQRRAYVIADNKLALNAGWDDAMLALELRDLQGMEFDLSLTGFESDDIAALLAGLDATPEGETEADAVPEVQAEVVTQPGDVWVLGKHRVMCGDSTDSLHVGKLMNGSTAQLLHADPPYGMGKESDGVANDNLYASDLDRFQMAWWLAWREWLANNGSAYIWGTPLNLWRLWLRGGLSDSEKMTLRNEITWRKPTVIGLKDGASRSFPDSERCLFFMRGAQGFNSNADNYWTGWEPIRSYLAAEVEAAGWVASDVKRITGVGMFSHWFTESQWVMIPENHYDKLKAEAAGKAFGRDYDALRRDYEALRRDHEALRRDFYATRGYFDNTHDAMSDVWEFPVVTGAERHGHATPKPVAMMARVMKTSLPPGGLCAEPFGGSGSTMIGAEQTGRACYTMELQPKYCDVIVRRWQQYTGKTATLESTGKPFPA